MPAQRPGASDPVVGTPPELLIAVCRLLGLPQFTCDLAASPDNAVCPEYFTEADDSLVQDWDQFTDGFCWLNPPFDRIAPWVQKAAGTSRARIVILVPASVGAEWWADHVEAHARVIPLRGRPTFVGHTDPYPKDCVLLIYGPHVTPGWNPGWKWFDTLTDEEKQMAKKRVGKAPKVREITRGRKKSGKAGKPPEDPKDLTAVEQAVEIAGAVSSIGRVTTFKPNGASQMQPAPAQPTTELGPLQIPTGEDAEKALRELAALNDRAIAAGKRYESSKAKAKEDKDTFDELNAQVSARLKVLTHPTDLPLFRENRENDQRRMEAAAENGGAVEGATDAPSDAPASDPAADVVSAGPETATPASEDGSIVGAISSEEPSIVEDETPF